MTPAGVRKALATLAASLALAACVPFPYGPYWRPEADGGRYSRAWCGGMEGPYTTVELDLASDVTATVRVVDGRDKSQNVFAILTARGEPVQFGSTVRLESPAGAQVLPARLGYIVVENGKARRIDVEGALAPAGGRPGTGTIEIPLPPSIDAFTFWLPEGQRGATRIAPVPVRFERRTLDAGFQAFNC